MSDEGTYYVVDEDRAAVVAGPFDDQEDARDDASDRTPGHIVAGSRVLDMIEMSSNQTLRWENSEDDVDIVTDGGVVPKQGDRPDEVPKFWEELSLAGKRIYLEEDASKNEALILVVHELGLDIDTDQIDTSDSLVHTDALGEVLSEIVAVNEVVHHLPDRDDLRIQADAFLDEDGEDGEDDDTNDADDDVDGGNDDDVDGAGEESGAEADSDEGDDAVPERSVAEDLQEQAAEGDDDSPWVRDAFADANNLGDSVITRLEDAGYSRVADLEAATEEELKENVSYVGRNKAKRIIELVEEYTGDDVDGEDDDPETEEDDEEELEEADEGGEDEGGARRTSRLRGTGHADVARRVVVLPRRGDQRRPRRLRIHARLGRRTRAPRRARRGDRRRRGGVHLMGRFVRDCHSCGAVSEDTYRCEECGRDLTGQDGGVRRAGVSR